MRALVEPPKALVEGGRVRYGSFNGPVADVNLIDASPWSFPVPRPLRALRLKEWQAFQFGNGRHFVTVALFNAKLMALAQVKVYDAERKTKAVFERKLPGWALTAPHNLLDSRMQWHEGAARVRFLNRLRAQRIDIELELPATSTSPRISGVVTAHAEGTVPQVVSIPFAENRGMYSHKACLAVTGELSVGGETVCFTRKNGFLFVDDHKGYYPRIMRWDWVIGGGFDGAGRRLGINLTRNDSLDPERFNENCLWLDGQPHLLPPVHFNRQSNVSPEVWQVRDAAGAVAVDFQVEVPGPVHIDALVIESRYNGPFGRLGGFVLGPANERIELAGLFGMGEDFYLRA